MDIMLISRPGISLFRSLRESETAWDAIRFYGPVSLSIGVYIPVSTLAGAISLCSDLRFFLRKYTADHLFKLTPMIYCTAALTKSRYLTRDHGLSDEWPYRLIYWIENSGTMRRMKKSDFNCAELFNSIHSMKTADEPVSLSSGYTRLPDSHTDSEIPTGYLLEVWCTKPEFEMR